VVAVHPDELATRIVTNIPFLGIHHRTDRLGYYLPFTVWLL
jgi:hypothetical protein